MFNVKNVLVYNGFYSRPKIDSNFQIQSWIQSEFGIRILNILVPNSEI